MNSMITMLIGGVALFLFAIHQLSSVLEKSFAHRAENIIKRYTKNIFAAILIGTIITAMTGSSSAVIIIVIVFINAKILDFPKAIGIIMGANIGTTISSQILAFNISQYSEFALLLGLVFYIFSKNKEVKNYASILLYFGMLFFGLYIMETSVLPLQGSPTFENWILRVENNRVEGALMGGLVTVIIQSSSATVGLAIVLGKQKLISIAGGIAIMLGAELGTCSNTLLATVKGSRQAIKAGLFHLVFNLTTITLGLIFFYPFVQLIEMVTVQDGIDNHIANAHVIFNVVGVLVFLPLVKPMEKLLNYLLPDKKEIKTIGVE